MGRALSVAALAMLIVLGAFAPAVVANADAVTPRAGAEGGNWFGLSDVGVSAALVGVALLVIGGSYLAGVAARRRNEKRKRKPDPLPPLFPNDEQGGDDR